MADNDELLLFRNLDFNKLVRLWFWPRLGCLQGANYPQVEGWPTRECLMFLNLLLLLLLLLDWGSHFWANLNMTVWWNDHDCLNSLNSGLSLMMLYCAHPEDDKESILKWKLHWLHRDTPPHPVQHLWLDSWKEINLELSQDLLRKPSKNWLQ